MSHLVLFTGKIASGKSTISRALADTLGGRRVSFGDAVRGEAISRGLDTQRSTLQHLGEQLIQAPELFCSLVLNNSNADKLLIIDGVRHVIIRETLITLSSMRKCLSVYVDIDEAIRLQRLRDRGESALADSHSTEVEVVGMRESSDLVVCGDGAKTNAVEQIAAALRLN